MITVNRNRISTKLIVIVFPFVITAVFFLSITINSGFASFDDNKPPSVTDLRVAQPEPPITPWDIVKIEAHIVDDESGVKNATLFYGTGENPEQITFVQIAMQLIDGNIFNGTFEGEIPPQLNGTQVWFYVSASDKAGNIYVYPSFKSYYVYLPSSYLYISIGVQNISMNELSATLRISVTALLPSPYKDQKLILHTSNKEQDILYDFEILTINMSRTSRFWYQNITYWKVHLIGNSNDYPFDTYHLNLNFTIWWGEIKKLKAENVYYAYGKLLNEWEEPTFENYTITNATYPEIIYNIQFNRSSYTVVPFHLVTLSIFFLIGGSLILSPKKLGDRLRIYLTAFIFIIGFLFQIKGYLPLHIGFTKAELIFFSLAIISTIFVIESMITSEIQGWYEKHAVLISLAGDLGIILLSLKIISLTSLPIEYFRIIILSLFYGWALRFFLGREYKYISFRRKNQ